MESISRIVTLASFVFEEKIISFKKYLNKRFRIPEDKIFIYTTPDDQQKMLTFRIYLRDGKKIDTKSFFPPTIIVHKKGECFYTINALNKLIEKETGGNRGNIDYKSHKINWDNYQGKMLIVKERDLIIMDIERNFS